MVAPPANGSWEVVVGVAQRHARVRCHRPHGGAVEAVLGEERQGAVEDPGARVLAARRARATHSFFWQPFWFGTVSGSGRNGRACAGISRGFDKPIITLVWLGFAYDVWRNSGVRAQADPKPDLKSLPKAKSHDQLTAEFRIRSPQLRYSFASHRQSKSRSPSRFFPRYRFGTCVWSVN